MALCRIYFFTYKRNYLISRSIGSLLDQTFKDWICEVHNDCPEDKFPEVYIKSLHDSRFIIKNHSSNLGGTGSFNLAFSGCKEKYASMLEDDNWWEPNFLEEMISLMDQKPSLDIAWSNMRIWKESNGNEWIDTEKNVWPAGNDQLFSWPQQQQSLGALHSTGAMMYRGINSRKYLIPNETLLDAVELIRERSFKHPIYLKNKVLANFSITTFTNRSKDQWKWTANQVMLIGSLVMTSKNKKKEFQEALSYYHKQKPTPVINFYLLIIFYLKDYSLLRFFKPHDWFVFCKWILRTNINLIKLKKYMNSQKNVYQYLLDHTQNRHKASSSTCSTTL